MPGRPLPSPPRNGEGAPPLVRDVTPSPLRGGLGRGLPGISKGTEADMKIIDAHCHVGSGVACSQTADDLLREMDRHKVDSAVIVPMDKYIAVLNREGNERILGIAGKYPKRLIPFATVNPWYGEQAVNELRRCFDLGAVGLKLHPPLQGFQITDAVVFPVVEYAVEQGMPVYFHTGTAVSSSPFQLTELAMRYPEGTFIMGHAAYADYWNDVAASVKAAPNVYIETSEHLPVFIRSLVTEVGADRIVYGSDSPKADMGIEIEKISRYIESADDLTRIFHKNLSKILGGKR